MKALVIRQPWAELIVSGKKTIEVRGWKTKMQEDFLVVAGKAPDLRMVALPGYKELCPGSSDPAGQLIYGMAVGIARVYKVTPFHAPEHERQAMLDWDGTSKLWAWHLGNVRRVAPFRVRGMPGFFNVRLTP